MTQRATTLLATLQFEACIAECDIGLTHARDLIDEGRFCVPRMDSLTHLRRHRTCRLPTASRVRAALDRWQTGDTPEAAHYLALLQRAIDALMTPPPADRGAADPPDLHQRPPAGRRAAVSRGRRTGQRHQLPR